MQAHTGVFSREGQSSISDQGFYAVMTIAVLWGLIGTAVTAYMTIKAGYVPGFWEIIIFGLAIPILGIIIAVKSDNPVVSFLGYNLIVIPFGVIIGPVVNEYSPNVVRNAFAITAGITLFMGFVGTIFPNFFSRLGAPLLLALFALLMVRVAQIFIPELAALSIVDYIAASIFSLYIGYDMYRASEVPRTIDNAIDIAVDLYLDVINLFLSILRILGGSSDDD